MLQSLYIPRLYLATTRAFKMPCMTGNLFIDLVSVLSPHHYQSVPVQRWEYDGSLQPGHLLRPHSDAHPGRPGPCGLSGPRERSHQDHHHPQWGHLPKSPGTWGPCIWEVHDWRRGVLVRTTLEVIQHGCWVCLRLMYHDRFVSWYCKKLVK